MQIIVAPIGYIVQLTFASFELEAGQTCLYDYVAIYDNIIANETDDIKAIGKYCGTEKPPTMMSTSRAITIIFKSDDSVNGQGFLATYNFIDARNRKYLFLMVFICSSIDEIFVFENWMENTKTY